MKLSGYGCSFIDGNELSSSDAAWPSLLAKNIGYEYHCRARSGSGNLQIMEQILRHGQHDDILIINWTWVDRFDFIDCVTEDWNTLRPALDRQHSDYYFRNLHSQYRDMLTNLCYINTALDFLISNNKKFMMTYLDHLILEKIHPNWHDPVAVEYLQKIVEPHLICFDDGMNFLEWSQEKGFPVSDLWHPLEQAHRSAADYFLPYIKTLIDK